MAECLRGQGSALRICSPAASRSTSSAGGSASARSTPRPRPKAGSSSGRMPTPSARGGPGQPSATDVFLAAMASSPGCGSFLASYCNCRLRFPSALFETAGLVLVVAQVAGAPVELRRSGALLLVDGGRGPRPCAPVHAPRYSQATHSQEAKRLCIRDVMTCRHFILSCLAFSSLP